MGCIINPIADDPTNPLLLAAIGAATFGETRQARPGQELKYFDQNIIQLEELLPWLLKTTLEMKWKRMRMRVHFSRFYLPVGLHFLSFLICHLC